MKRSLIIIIIVLFVIAVVAYLMSTNGVQTPKQSSSAPTEEQVLQSLNASTSQKVSTSTLTSLSTGNNAATSSSTSVPISPAEQKVLNSLSVPNK